MSWYRKKTKFLILIILLFGLSIGYAYVYGDFKVNGIAGVNKQGWEVYWDNAQVVQGSISQTAPTIVAGTNNTANTKVSFQVDLTNPGQYYEFTVDAVNNGTIDAMITNIEKTVNDIDVNSEQCPLPAYVSYIVTYADGTEIEENQLLAKKTNDTATTQKYKVKVEFLSNVDSSSLGSEVLTLNFKFGITYGQATSSATPVTAEP